jgi:NADH-quinone oxidoreductase subunit D
VDGEPCQSQADHQLFAPGWEKLTENRKYPQIIPMADRLCYGASMSWSHLYCLTIEDMM